VIRDEGIGAELRLHAISALTIHAYYARLLEVGVHFKTMILLRISAFIRYGTGALKHHRYNPG